MGGGLGGSHNLFPALSLLAPGVHKALLLKRDEPQPGSL